MLRVLTLSTLFPNAAQPTLGIFVERQTIGLAGLPGVEVEVAAPIGLPPWPLAYHPRYRARAGLPVEEEWKGLKVHRPRFPILPVIGAGRTPKSIAGSLLPLVRRIRERFAFDVIDAEFFWPDGPAAMHLSKALGVPFSVTARGSDIQYWMHRSAAADQILAAANAAGGMLAVSGALKRVMAGFGMPEERIRTHYTGVDHSRFQPVERDQAKRELGIAGPLILTVGALIPGKGQRVAIETAERIPEATLLLVGQGPDRRALEAIIRRKGLGERVRLLGARPHAEVAALMAAADVMLLPSKSEGLANVWVEALASGTPVVTCDVGGAREVIDAPELGMLIPADPDLMAAAIRKILADPPDQSRLRAASMRFSCKANTQSLFNHLSEVVAGGPVS